MDQNIFESFVKERLPRPDDKQLFEKLFEIYCKEGKDAVVSHLKDLIAVTEE